MIWKYVNKLPSFAEVVFSLQRLIRKWVLCVSFLALLALFLPLVGAVLFCVTDS